MKPKGKQMYLYHFFDRRTGPFRSLTDISREEAEDVIRKIRQERPDSQCAQRHVTMWNTGITVKPS